MAQSRPTLTTHRFLTLLCLVLSTGQLAADDDSDDDFDAMNFLEKFGYLDDLGAGQPDHSEATTREAVREFQGFNGLQATGRLDQATVRKMQQPRCGLPDVMKPSQRGVRPVASKPIAFYVPGYKWDRKNLSYKVTGYTRQLGGIQQDAAFRNAFQKWVDVVPLNFRSVTSGNADIDVSFVRGQHNDGLGNSFDGRGGTLAHAFFPGTTPMAGDTHFDDDEQWTLGTEKGTNLEIVAAHEFGHALGMAHSNVPTALMAPYYQGYDPNYSLHRDDIAGIQTLYGRGRGSISGSNSGGSPRVTTPPRTTPAPRGRYCDVKFDAIAQSPDGRLYFAFQGSQVFKVGARVIEQQLNITSLFPGAPSSPGAAVYVKNTKELFIFKGQRYWRYSSSRSGNQLYPGYPRNLPTDFQNMQAAIQWSDGGIYLFTKDKKYARWTEGLTRFSNGYPRLVSSFWQSAPANVQAAVQGQDGYYYLFNGRKYWKYNARAQLQSGYPKDTRPAWLSCGATIPR